MFSHVGWSELLVLAIVGLVVFGPERLPKAAADAARAVRELRKLARGAAADLKAELGPEIADLDLASLHPRRLVASVLDDEEDPAQTAPRPVSRRQALTAAMAPGQVPPYDDDAT
jgi:sec-independent protein translocase protein TatB